MSPRAACRLMDLGFENVFDYELGIADWKGAGLPIEGDGDRRLTAADAMSTDIPTCIAAETIGEVRTRIAGTQWDDCLVTDCDDLVVGRLRSKHMELAPASVIRDVMEVGPTSVRADEDLAALAERMDRRPTPLVVVATAQGELLGIVKRDDAHTVLAGKRLEREWSDCEGCPGRWK